MGLISQILEKICGRVHFLVFVDGNPAAEVELKDKEIFVEIKNPILAIEFGLEEFFSSGGKTNAFKKIKDLGYKIRIKYRMFEVKL